MIAHRAFKRWWICAGMVWLLFLTHAALAEQITLLSFYEIESSDSRTLLPVTQTGGVVIWREERPFSPRPNETLRDGDVVQTSPTSATQVAFASGHRVLVMPGTRLRLGRLFLFVGELLVRARGVFHIETSFMTAGVEGTEFLMRSEGAGDTVDVIVTEGAVLCRSNAGIWSPVRVAEAEHLRARSSQSTPEEPVAEDATVLFRGPGNSIVQKAPARGFELARIQALGRELGGGKGR